MLQFSLADGLGNNFSRLLDIRAGTVVSPAGQTQQAQTASADPMTSFGHAAAIKLMTRIKRLPPEVRLDFLKKSLDAIDSQLWGKTDTAAKGYMASGQDAMVAYLAALSQNLSLDLVTRLATVGEAAQNAGLGSLLTDKLNLISQTQVIMPAAPAVGECTADKSLIWTGTAWRHRMVGEACQTVGTQTVNARTDGQGGVAVTSTTMVQVGPFTCPAPRSDKLIWLYDEYGLLTPEQAKFIGDALKTKLSDNSNFGPVTESMMSEPAPGQTSTLAFKDGSAFHSTWPAGDWLTYGGWLKRFGMSAGDGIELNYLGFDRGKYSPIAKFTNPVNNEEWGLWIRVQPVGPAITATSTVIVKPDGTTADISTTGQTPLQTTSYALQFMVAKLPEESWWDKVKNGIRKVIAKFYEFIVELAKVLSDILCTVAANPGPAVTGVTAAYGPGAGAATGAGLMVIADKCAKPPPPELPQLDDPAPPQKKFPWGPVIAGGVAVAGVAAFLLRSPKKKPA